MLASSNSNSLFGSGGVIPAASNLKQYTHQRHQMHQNQSQCVASNLQNYWSNLMAANVAPKVQQLQQQQQAAASVMNPQMLADHQRLQQEYASLFRGKGNVDLLGQGMLGNLQAYPWQSGIDVQYPGAAWGTVQNIMNPHLDAQSCPVVPLQQGGMVNAQAFEQQLAAYPQCNYGFFRSPFPADAFGPFNGGRDLNIRI
jgi:hypothetical protein